MNIIDSKPIRILHVLGSMNHGGIQSLLMNIYRHIDRENFQFDFIVHTDQECIYQSEIKTLGGKIFSCPKYVGKNHFQYKKWWNNFLHQNQEYRIIHGHMRSTAAIYLRLANQHGLVTISHSHNSSSGNGVTALIKSIMQYPIRYTAQYMFACSKLAGLWLFGEKACKKNNFHIINNAIDPYKFKYDEVIRLRKRKELNIEDRFVVGHVGRFTHQKNHVKILEIFKEIVQRDKNAVLMLVGDGEERANIELKVRDLGIDNNILILGASSEISNLMQAMDVFLFPSLFEGLGIVVIEAQAAGLKCVIADTVPNETHISELIEVLSLKDPPYKWAEKVLEFSNSAYKRKDNIQSIIKHHYDIQGTTNWIQEFYKKVEEE